MGEHKTTVESSDGSIVYVSHKGTKLPISLSELAIWRQMTQAERRDLVLTFKKIKRRGTVVKKGLGYLPGKKGNGS